MKTNFYDINLMMPAQLNKEIIFNEALVRVDGFLNSTIKGFVEQVPQEYKIGDKYIVSSGEYKNQICYIFAHSHQWQFLKARNGMRFFCQELDEMICFDGDSWRVANALSDFKLKGHFYVQNTTQYLSLHLEDDAVIDLSNARANKITIILMQNKIKTYQVQWGGDILWPNGIVHSVSRNLGAIEVIEFYKIAASGKFLSTVISNNYYQD